MSSRRISTSGTPTVRAAGSPRSATIYCASGARSPRHATPSEASWTAGSTSTPACCGTRSAVRDYQSAQIAIKQNQIVQRLGVIASLLLVPTFIVGVYGQNFHNMPELRWHLGYGFSWGLIIVVTILQLAFYRWKKWI
jgi:hypothetical protein